MLVARRARLLGLLTALAVLVALLALVAPSAIGAGTPGLKTRLTAALHGKWLSPGRTAAVAVDLRTGEVVFAHNARRPFAPASNEKLPVAWVSLMRLGPDARFPTELIGSGTRRGAVWDGDLVLKGFGDPTLTSADLDALARAVRARGIRWITGGVLGDESFFDSRRGAPGWKRGFLGIESPPLSALVVDRALGWPAAAPPLLAARALRNALQRQRIRVSGIAGIGLAPPEGVRLAQTSSEPLARIVAEMDTNSDNFVAELLLKQIGTVDGAVGTTANGAAIVHDELVAAGIPVDGVRIVDGSGLSLDDRLTAETLVGVIRTALADPEIAGVFRASLAISGRTGTLARRYGMPAGVVRGKTGTTDLACSLSGVVRGTYAFAVMQNGDPVASWAAREAQDRFVTQLAAEPTARG